MRTELFLPYTKPMDMMPDAVTANGTPVWLSLCGDCESNERGYYCEIYLDADCSEPFDNFVVHADEIAHSEVPYDEAWRMASEYVRSIREY